MVCNIIRYILCLFAACAWHLAGCFAAGCALVCWLRQGLVVALVSYSFAGVSFWEKLPTRGYTVDCVFDYTLIQSLRLRGAVLEQSFLSLSNSENK